MKRVVYFAFFVLLFVGCNHRGQQLSDKGTLILQRDGEDNDTVEYSCRHCSTLFDDDSIAFQYVVQQLQQEGLSQITDMPHVRFTKLKLNVEPQKGIRYYETGDTLNNIYHITGNWYYKSIYENDQDQPHTCEVNSYFKKEKKSWVILPEFQYSVMLEPLTMDKEHHCSRNCEVRNGNKKLTLIPEPNGSLTVKSSVMCVVKGASLKFIFDDGAEFIKQSVNPDNCDGVSLYDHFSATEKQFLTERKLKRIFFYSNGQSAMMPVPNNEKDYFQQLFRLLGSQK